MLMPDKGIKSSYRASVLKISVCAALTVIALALSYLESIITAEIIIPVPGIKPGLANIMIMLAFFRLSPAYAAAVSLLRIILAALLFGSPVSFIYSCAGALLAFTAIAVTASLFRKEKISYAGVSALSAVFHNIGQICAAVFLLRNTAPLYYLLPLVISGVVMGFLSGIVANLLDYPMRKIINTH